MELYNKSTHKKVSKLNLYRHLGLNGLARWNSHSVSECSILGLCSSTTGSGSGSDVGGGSFVVVVAAVLAALALVNMFMRVDSGSNSTRASTGRTTSTDSCTSTVTTSHSL